MLKDFILKRSITRYLKQLNNKSLKVYYINMSTKQPKSHVDNVIIKCCVNELEKRAII